MKKARNRITRRSRIKRIIRSILFFQTLFFFVFSNDNISAQSDSNIEAEQCKSVEFLVKINGHLVFNRNHFFRAINVSKFGGDIIIDCYWEPWHERKLLDCVNSTYVRYNLMVSVFPNKKNADFETVLQWGLTAGHLLGAVSIAYRVRNADIEIKKLNYMAQVGYFKHFRELSEQQRIAWFSEFVSAFSKIEHFLCDLSKGDDNEFMANIGNVQK